MAMRTISLILLMVAAFVIAGVASAIAATGAASLGLPTGSWLLPATLFLSTVTIFFVARDYILPTHVAQSDRVLIVIALWIGGSMLVVAGAVWVLQQTSLATLLSGTRIIIAWFLLLLGVGLLIDTRR